VQVRKAIIPAAGLGTRLLPSTKAMPKEMLPIIDKPTIQYIVEEAVASGIKDIIIVTGKGKKAIEDHFDTSWLLEETLKEKGKNETLKDIKQISELANIFYIRQGVPRGLGHAIWCARTFIGNEPFAVLLGDTIVKGNEPYLKSMIELFEQYQTSIIGIKTVEKHEVSRYGIVGGEKIEDSIYKIDRLIEKPAPEQAPTNLAILGRYILTPKVFDLLEKQKPGVGNEIQLTDALESLLIYENIYAKILDGKSYDIGEKIGYLKTMIDFALDRDDLKEEILDYLQKLIK
jgi:UTP--glucose-1-phosphate uridylyltransferase